MTALEIIFATIFVTLSILLAALAMSTLQLIKELKISLSKINKLLDNPDNITPLPVHPFKKLEETLSFSHPVKSNSPPHLFHRQKGN